MTSDIRDQSLFMAGGRRKNWWGATKIFWWTGSGLGKKLRSPEWASKYFFLENFPFRFSATQMSVAEWAADFLARALSGLQKFSRKMLLSSAPSVINNDWSISLNKLTPAHVPCKCKKEGLDSTHYKVFFLGKCWSVTLNWQHQIVGDMFTHQQHTRITTNIPAISAKSQVFCNSGDAPLTCEFGNCLSFRAREFCAEWYKGPQGMASLVWTKSRVVFFRVSLCYNLVARRAYASMQVAWHFAVCFGVKDLSAVCEIHPQLQGQKNSSGR